MGPFDEPTKTPVLAFPGIGPPDTLDKAGKGLQTQTKPRQTIPG